jgi:hypothetical protein
MMNTWSRIRQAVDAASRTAAPWIARAAGAAAVVVGVRAVWYGLSSKYGLQLAEGSLLVALGIGVVLLRPTALKLATILSVLLAMILTIGILNPFAAGDLPSARIHTPGFVAERITVALLSAVGFVLLGHFLGIARIQAAARARKDQS